MLIADVKIKLKRIKRAKQTLRYDVDNIGLEFAAEVRTGSTDFNWQTENRKNYGTISVT